MTTCLTFKGQTFCVTLEDETDTLSRNVGNQLRTYGLVFYDCLTPVGADMLLRNFGAQFPTYDAQHSSRVKTFNYTSRLQGYRAPCYSGNFSDTPVGQCSLVSTMTGANYYPQQQGIDSYRVLTSEYDLKKE